jgi:hypothetical protein
MELFHMQTGISDTSSGYNDVKNIIQQAGLAGDRRIYAVLAAARTAHASGLLNSEA